MGIRCLHRGLLNPNCQACFENWFYNKPQEAPVQFEPIPGVLVLGLGHKARHGKDSCAQALIEAAPADVMRFGFADALYDYCRIEHGMTTKDAPLLQRVGVQFREERDPLAWVKAVYYKILDKKPKVAVITDVRFTNEADFVKALGGYTIKVERRNADDSVFQTADRDPNHVSETQLNDYPWDLTITNYQLVQTRYNAVMAMNFFRQKYEVEAARV